MITTSIRLSFVGWHVDCSTNTSRPRTFSSSSTIASPSLNLPTTARPRLMFRCRHTACASFGFALPVKMRIRSKAMADGRWAREKRARASRAAACSMSIGWGGRDRTYECRNQNPVPYHLATPQRKPSLRAGDAAAGPSSLSAVPDPPRTGFRESPSPRETVPADAAPASRPRGPRSHAGNAFTARRLPRPRFRKAAITAAPEPVIRAPGTTSQRMRAREPHRDTATPRPARDRCGRNSRKRRSIFADAVHRVNSGLAKMRAVGTCVAGIARASHCRGSETGCHALADAAHERILAVHEERNVGAERQRRAPRARRAESSSRHRRLRPSSTLAASELPPPSPAPSGIRLSIRIATPCARPGRLLQRTARRGPPGPPFAGTPSTSFVRTIAPSDVSVSVTVSARSISANSDSIR